MAAFSTFLRFLKWKMDGKWKTDSSPFGVARKPWRDSPGGRPEEAAYPTRPASGHLARLALRGSTCGLPVIRPESRFCCWALPTKISLLSAIPRNLQPCDLSLPERRRAARGWPCSEPRRAYEPARLYQRSTRNARREQQPPAQQTQCFRTESWCPSYFVC